MNRLLRCVLCWFLSSSFALSTEAQVGFEEAVVDVGNVGLTVTNAGFVGRANVRSTPTGAPSFEYPLDSGVEHLFESGLWIGSTRHPSRAAGDRRLLAHSLALASVARPPSGWTIAVAW